MLFRVVRICYIRKSMDSRFILQERFSAGAQSEIWEAWDKFQGEKCFLKAGPLVEQEAFLALQLNHPYIAAPYDFGRHPDLGCFAAYSRFEFCNLLDLCRDRPPSSEFQVLVLKITEVLAFLHHRGWLYNDFKPEHFLVSNQQQLKVLDLGLCSPLESFRESSNQTYSGTFPYIAPERLLGRKCDQRSDLFAFGMMLLRLFFPNENWNADPSLPKLHEFQKRKEDLTGFWRQTISQMIAMEPAQRIGSAVELWHKLLPSSAKKLFLFFPQSAATQEPDAKQNGAGLTLIQSAASSSLQAAETGLILSRWRQGHSTFTVDLRSRPLHQVIRSLASALSGGSSFDFYSSVDFLERFKGDHKISLIFRHPEFLSQSDRSLFEFTLNCLSRSEGFRIAVLSKRSLFNESAYSRTEIGYLQKSDLNRFLSDILPVPAYSLLTEELKSKSFTLPDQIFLNLKNRLSEAHRDLWPAVAHEVHSHAPVERLDLVQKRFLAALALAGGRLPSEILQRILNRSEKEFDELILVLKELSYVQPLEGSISLVIPPEQLLGRIRKEQLRKLCRSLMAALSADQHRVAAYHVALNAGRRKTAASLAVSYAKDLLGSGQRTEAYAWFWKAFSAGAMLPPGLLYVLTAYFLRQAEMRKAKKLLIYVNQRKHRFCKYRCLVLDYYVRRERYDLAKNIAEHAVAVAVARNRPRAAAYFQIRLAGFLIQLQKFQDGESILENLDQKEICRTNRLQGLIRHFYGLSLFYRGRLDEALQKLEEAVKMKHSLRSISLMNLGIVLGKKGDFERSEINLRKAIEVFTEEEDADRLCLAYSNLGLLLKLKGQTYQAREYLFRSLHLSRVGRKIKTLIAVLDNLSTIYELEGRTAKALFFLNKVARLSEKRKIEVSLASALTSQGYLYALLGRRRKALMLLHRALEIRKKLGVKVNLASSYEHVGLTHYLSGHNHKALHYFELANSLYKESGAVRDLVKVKIFIALVLWKKKNFQEMKSLLDEVAESPKSPFVEGLYYYALAAWQLDSTVEGYESPKEALHRAERNFRSAPALFWLGKLYLLRAEYLQRMDHFEKAGIVLRSAYDLFTQLGARRELFRMQREGWDTMNQNFLEIAAEKLPFKMLVLVRDIMSSYTSDEMVDRILAKALEFSDMERAVLILNQDPIRVFRSAAIEQPDIEDIRAISLSAVKEATDRNQPFISYDVAAMDELKSRPSIIANQIMSIVCLPLRTQDKVIGVLYLDSSEKVEFLSPGERVLLEIFASIIAIALDQSLTLQRSVTENIQLRASFGLSQSFPEILAKSTVMMEIFKKMERLLDTDLPVLITGETGTGKELVARVIHYRSKRKNAPFVAVNCSALPKTLLESELFGHEKGAFTGATNIKLGLFEEAKNGTLFLDEIAEIPRSMQAKLLRVLQEGEFRRLGGNRTLHTNARVICATNSDLQVAVKKKRFREDLYYRIKRAHIHLPSLRERKEDIPILASHFLKSSAAIAQKKIQGFTAETIQAIKNYEWPGNVRELKNEIERVIAFTDQDWIRPAELEPYILSSNGKPKSSDDQQTLKEIEKRVLLQRLEESEWNVARAAKSLGLTRNGLYSKMKQFGITRSTIH
jgi:transcriptional regulator with GAF, ATPase, and Fis domain/serine/threonine protein kinase